MKLFPGEAHKAGDTSMHETGIDGCPVNGEVAEFGVAPAVLVNLVDFEGEPEEMENGDDSGIAPCFHSELDHQELDTEAKDE